MKKKSPANSRRTVANKSHLELSRNVRQPLSSPARHQPISLLPLIGRKQEIETICALLPQSEVRLLTLTGPGGVGKTSLALQISAEVRSLFTDGIRFVSLVSIDNSDLVLPTIAKALNLMERSNSNLLAQIQVAIQGKRFLLLLDNFEHVATAAPQLKELLAVCPELKILVTSRIVLGLLEPWGQ